MWQNQFVKEMLGTIVKTVNPVKVVLFGSWATGKQTRDSDIDFLVVENRSFDENHSRRKEASKLWRALAKFPVSKDILVYSESEIEIWKDSLNHVISRALKEGVVLYEQ